MKRFKHLPNPEEMINVPDHTDEGWLAYLDWVDGCLPAPEGLSLLHKQTLGEISVRLASRQSEEAPRTDSENRLDIFEEQLAPWVHNTVTNMDQMGYRLLKPDKAGLMFGGAIQTLRIEGRLDPTITDQLTKIDFRVFPMFGDQTIIGFRPNSHANEAELATRWNVLAELLPEAV